MTQCELCERTFDKPPASLEYLCDWCILRQSFCKHFNFTTFCEGYGEDGTGLCNQRCFGILKKGRKMTVSYDKQIDIIEMLKATGLNPGIITPEFEYGTDTRIRMRVKSFDEPWGFDNWEDEKQEAWTIEKHAAKRRIKEVFGPFVATGEAPYVELEGIVEMDETVITVRWPGEFKCEVSEIKVFEKSEEDVKRAIERADRDLKEMASQFIGAMFLIPMMDTKREYTCTPAAR